MTDNDEKKSKKKKIVVIIVIVILIALLAVGAYSLIQYINWLKNQNNNTGLKTEPNVVLDDGDLEGEHVSSINVHINKNIEVKKDSNGKYIMELKAVNGNPFQYILDVSVDDKEIYKSGLIPAGMELPEVELDGLDLKPGTYDGVVIFTAISSKDNETVMGSTGVQVTLTVKE